MCVHVLACACVWGHPPTTPQPHPPTPPQPQELQGAQTPKFNKSWTNRDNLILFWRFFTSEHFWTHIYYSWSPQTPPHPPALPPRAEETQIRRITITLERIKIIQFCLKIWDRWTLLHTYRLGLMCRLGGVLSQMALLCFWPKKCSCDPPIKKFPIFALDSIRPYLDWALTGFLTS